MLAALQGWTNETIDRAILDPDMQKEMLEALRLSGEVRRVRVR